MICRNNASQLLKSINYSSKAAAHIASPTHLTINSIEYLKDPEYTNIPLSILQKIPLQLHNQPNHPLSILKRKIYSHFSKFQFVDNINSPVVSVKSNFDDLLIGEDHSGRGLTDTYYVDSKHVLRTHTSAHQGEILQKMKGNDGYLVTADVYRRDEIDSSHYPVFHQMEGIKLFTADGLKELEADQKNDKGQDNIPDVAVQACHSTHSSQLVANHLKKNFEALVFDLFSHEKDLKIRWIKAYFPFTSPSWEMEILYQGKWLEIMGCGVMRQEILDRNGHDDKIGWAFGLGLERIAMVLFSIPDIRLFWSKDPRFLSQFSDGKIKKFVPFSKYPACYKDISFWCGTKTDFEDPSPQHMLHYNEFCDLVREVAGDLVEDVTLIDEFFNPKTLRVSRCYRINYRSMERTCSNEEIDVLQDRIRELVAQKYNVELR